MTKPALPLTLPEQNTEGNQAAMLRAIMAGLENGFRGNGLLEWLETYEGDFSVAAAPHASATITKLRNARDCFQQATNSACGWCTLMKAYIPAYLAALEAPDATARNCLMQALVDGDAVLVTAISKLSECSTWLTDALGSLTALRAQLRYDFEEDTAARRQYVESIAENVRSYTAPGGAAVSGLVVTATACFFVGPFGLAVLIPSGFVGGKAGGAMSDAVIYKVYGPELDAQLATVQTKFATLQAHVTETSTGIETALHALRGEAEAVTLLQAKRTVSATFMGFGNMPLRNVAPEANALLATCTTYLVDHPSLTDSVEA
ncbi:hypothetical protein SDRG_11378 [Saprolegnia diclina VS20]|uniref:Uncharacterized protein n=1 Tax=Saprolegnia diclina (strain VS20) TaxID=1156394 RepID=T0RLM5_SAPDV|nr:hypothetical protein SDRG_11378 [Saprolegnia diclina VS20]EQC30897.1 hypothetical protein SDRG_11378 [Saprolegnia diclina VS20]|eukprot:XP_008615635.1 hypothetical protein SDRG_11378 [Saprolegnia diclina VS20]